MINFLLRLFMGKNPNNMEPEVRQKYGNLAGTVGLFCNFSLALLKLILGIVTGAVSIAADAINNFSDTCVSVVTLVGVRISGKSADKEHPYGHGRFEYVAGFIISAAVVAVALELLRTSIGKLIEGSEPEVDVLTTILLALAIGVKLWMGLFYREIGKRIDSPAMRASAMDSLTDCISTSVALVSVLLMLFFGINVDAYAGALVALLVLYAGGRSAYETIEPLLGKAPGAEVVEKIAKIAYAHPEIIGTHDLRVHEYGPGHMIASMHVEMSDSMSLMSAHAVIDVIEQETIKQGLVQEFTIHIDPVKVNDDKMNRYKKLARKTAKEIAPSVNVHDFRMSSEDGKDKLVFELMSPYELELGDEEVAEKMRAAFAREFPELEIKLLSERGEGMPECYEDRKKGV